MSMQSINPATGELLETVEYWDDLRLEHALAASAAASSVWRQVPLADRCQFLRTVAQVLRDDIQAFAALVTDEMGKLLSEAKAEIEKCAWVCDYYADKAPEFLQNEQIVTDASSSYVTYQPLGSVLAVMPWNFPIWQVFRFAAPSLVAGNVGLLKHASNVPRCARKIEQIFRQAGGLEALFTTLFIPAAKVAQVIKDPRVHAVTLTGSEPAGRNVAENAGQCLKPSLLELGGSDPFIVFPDADIDDAVHWGVVSRFLNAGQSCIAAKRFILVGKAADLFLDKFVAAVSALKTGDPKSAQTTLAPMARLDLRDELHQQVTQAIDQGAVARCGCEPVDGPGAFYQPSVLDKVEAGNIAFEEEFFGPVAIVLRAKDAEHAITLANATRFGLGGSVWTQNKTLAEQVALKLECGSTFVNGLVKSDPRLPFGGIKASGYGRELSHLGIHEFVNAKTVWIK